MTQVRRMSKDSGISYREIKVLEKRSSESLGDNLKLSHGISLYILVSGVIVIQFGIFSKFETENSP